MRRAARTGVPVWNSEFEIVFDDGQAREIIVNAVPLLDAAGSPRGAMGCALDITGRRAIELALKEAHEQLANRAKQLEKLVDKRTAKLQEAIGELETFSYTIAHDLRAPLRSMQGYGEFLAKEYGGSIDSRGQGYLRRITAAAERMDQLIRDVLNYSQIVRADLPMEPVDMEKLLTGIVQTYPAFQDEATAIQLEGPFPRVLGNEALLTQCFSNLLGNAIKFVAPGTKPNVRVRAETNRQAVKFLVQDNGIGIASDQHEKIFALFQRIDKSYEGTGIGLAIVKKAAERMAGRVGVLSQPNKGSTFWIELKPASRAK
jgi:signal transduction histidine kinase